MEYGYKVIDENGCDGSKEDCYESLTDRANVRFFVLSATPIHDLRCLN